MTDRGQSRHSGERRPFLVRRRHLLYLQSRSHLCPRTMSARWHPDPGSGTFPSHSSIVTVPICAIFVFVGHSMWAIHPWCKDIILCLIYSACSLNGPATRSRQGEVRLFETSRSGLCYPSPLNFPALFVGCSLEFLASFLQMCVAFMK